MKVAQCILAAVTASCLLSSLPSHARPSPTAFTYQGRITNGATPVGGLADLEFRLWTAAVGGAQVGAPSVHNAVPVAEGVFTAELDFGPGAFNGSERWLQISVRAPAGVGGFTTLSSRQAVLSTPTAQFASQVSPSGISGVITNPVTFSSASNSFTGNGSLLTALNASSISSGTLSSSVLSGGYANALNFSNGANQYAGTFNGSGASLTNLNASNITSGTLADTRLSSNVATLNSVQSISGFKTFGSFGVPSTFFKVASSGGGVQGIQLRYFSDDYGWNIESTDDVNTRGLYFKSNFATPTQTTRLFISGNSGFVGVGTTAPGYKFVVQAPTDSFGVVHTDGTSSIGSYLGVNTAYFGTLSNTPLNLFTTSNGIPRLTIDTAGSVGVGTTAPGAQFDVVNSWPAGVSNTAIFRAPNTGPNISHVHYGATGDWYIRSATNTGTVILNDYGGNVGVGTATPAYKLDVAGTFAANTVTIKGGSDLVEGFDSRFGRLEPGTVMVIDPDHAGQLMPSTRAYDSKVAGVVSGAGGVNAGLKMGQDGVMDGENLVALTGRVYVKCSAINGSIRPGDRLTTSAIAGHAMKAIDADQTDGAVIGKAMSSLDSGDGLVLVLVNLQ